MGTLLSVSVKICYGKHALYGFLYPHLFRCLSCFWFWWTLLCELFFHNIICEHASMQMVVTIFTYMGGFHLRAFMPFMRNQIEWHLSTKYMDANEEMTTFWIWAELGLVAELRREFRKILSTPGIREPAIAYRRRVMDFFLNQFSKMKSQSLIGCLKCTEASSFELLEGDPFAFQNSVVTFTHVPTYAQVINTLGTSWLGLRFKFPLIFLPIEEFQVRYGMSEYEEESWTWQVMSNQGYIFPDEDTTDAYDFTDLHNIYYQGRWDFCMRACKWFSWREMLGAIFVLISYIYFPHFYLVTSNLGTTFAFFPSFYLKKIFFFLISLSWCFVDYCDVSFPFYG